MELIKLPIDLGMRVSKILNEEHNIQSRKNNLGLISFEFTQEELDLIKKLEIINPVRNSILGIENLRNLESLKISTLSSSEYAYSPITIKDTSIYAINKLKKLRNLEIINQNDIDYIDLTGMDNLEFVTIVGNNHLCELLGLDTLKNLASINIYGNEELYSIDHLREAIKQSFLGELELDTIYYPELIGYDIRTDTYDQEMISHLEQIVDCHFSEIVTNKPTKIPFSAMKKVDEKCRNIVKDIRSRATGVKETVIGIEKYLAENVEYDRDGLTDNKRRAGTPVEINGMKLRMTQGFKYGTNGSFNAIMYNKCVCEGYTRAMRYLLKLCNIKSRAVACIAGANQIESVTYNDRVISTRNLSNGYHSIINITDEFALYCDPCWDACRYQQGDETFKYCLLNKEEISKTHTLSFDENNIANSHITVPREYIIDTLRSLEKQKNR